MQENPVYDDLIPDLLGFFRERIDACTQAGVARERLLLDPGFGFGKTMRHNLLLLNQLGRFAELGLPLLAGISRKSMIGAVLDKPAAERLYGSLAAAVLAAERGAVILRVHDVGPTVDALKVADAVLGAGA